MFFVPRPNRIPKEIYNLAKVTETNMGYIIKRYGLNVMRIAQLLSYNCNNVTWKLGDNEMELSEFIQARIYFEDHMQLDEPFYVNGEFLP